MSRIAQAVPSFFSRLAALMAVMVLVAACATQAGTDTRDDARTGAPTPGSVEDFKTTATDRVFFAFDRSDLDASARQTLQRQAAWLKQYGNVTVTIEGHCDERGTREYNLALGARRANAVREYLVSLGISPSRIQTISYGKERPAALGSNEEAWRLNRRGVTVLSGAPSS
jgi:peptidoglycan-associated lipoprotein